MGKGMVTNLRETHRFLHRMANLPEKVLRERIKASVTLVHKGVTGRTPVHTGTTLRNFVWTVGAPYNGGELPPIGHNDPGITSTMPLGPEPRRAANQAAADATLKSLDLSNPFQSFWLSNNSASVAGLEYGVLPTHKNKQRRNPAGMFRVTMQDLLLALRTI